MVILENIDIDIDIDKAILQNIDIDKISNRFKFGISNRATPQSCTETDFEMKTSNFVLFLLISVVSVHFRAIYDEIIHCQA